MQPIRSEKGQALIIIALAAILLFGFAALAIDVTRVLSDRRNAQNAADTSAIAAALAKIRKQDYVVAATNRAASNGYQTDADSTVTINLCSDTGITCTGLPASAKKGEYIKVEIVSTVPMTFARVLGRTQMTNRVEAIARAVGTVNTTSPFTGAGLVSVKGGANDDCFKVNGNANLVIHDAGVSVNCTGNSALFLNGSADINMDADARVAGCANNTGFDIGTGNISCNQPESTIDASTFASYPTKPATPTCLYQGNPDSEPLQPGYFNSIVTIGSARTFAPGTYCLNAGIRFTGGGSISGSGTGTVQLVLNQDLYIKSPSTFDDLEVYMSAGSFGTSTASSSLITNRFRFYGTGTGSLDIQNGTLTSGDAYIYSEAGTISIQSQAVTNLTAPTSGDYAGLLMYMPWSNTNAFSINGGTGSTWNGLVLVPHSDVTYNGGAGFEIHGQVIGYTLNILGSGQSNIFYESNAATPIPDDPSIQLTK